MNGRLEVFYPTPAQDRQGNPSPAPSALLPLGLALALHHPHPKKTDHSDKPPSISKVSSDPCACLPAHGRIFEPLLASRHLGELPGLQHEQGGHRAGGLKPLSPRSIPGALLSPRGVQPGQVG